MVLSGFSGFLRYSKNKAFWNFTKFVIVTRLRFGCPSILVDWLNFINIKSLVIIDYFNIVKPKFFVFILPSLAGRCPNRGWQRPRTKYPSWYSPIGGCFQRNSFCCKAWTARKTQAPPRLGWCVVESRKKKCKISVRTKKIHIVFIPRNSKGNRVCRAMPPGQLFGNHSHRKWGLSLPEHLGPSWTTR